MNEKVRIRQVYREYGRSNLYRKRWAGGPGNDYLHDDRWATTAKHLDRLGFRPARASILDVGSSRGEEIRRFVDLGCRLESIVCLDLITDCVAGGKREHPTVPFLSADASRLPFRDGQFDLVNQSVMVSSTLDRGKRAAIAAEMLRVTRPGGMIVWYDVRYRNPFNRWTRPITRRELSHWFRGCRGSIVSMTLIPPIARTLAPVSTPLCRILERFPPLRSHLLAVLVKP